LTGCNAAGDLPIIMVRRFALKLIFPLAVVLGGCSLLGPSGEALSAQDFGVLNRLTWGASELDLAEYRRLGRAGWIEAQLTAPADQVRLLPAAKALYDMLGDGPEPPMAAMVRLARQRKDAQVAKKIDVSTGRARYRAYNDEARDWFQRAVERSIVRDLYSRDQLREQMTWFWFNHFNIRFVGTGYGSLSNHYLETVIRPRALGKFCDLVRATQRHPAMLLYLNNAQSRAGQINENYARELLELHTMGVGSGYTQTDVQQLARVLTGLTVDLRQWPPPPAPPGGMRDGITLFDPALHDGGPKRVLGAVITATGMAGIEQATDLACHHPATARRISHRLAQYLLADAPPSAVVDAMAAEFTRTDGDIAAVLRLMFARPEFAASLGKLFKDPNHYILSAVRFSFGDKVIEDAGDLVTVTRHMGQSRMSRPTPDGWPLEAANWNASGQLDMRFALAGTIARGGGRLFARREEGKLALIKARLSVPDLADTRARTGIYAKLAPATQAALAKATDTKERTALFLSSPEFMRR
jgi:uncharacterized protein (DUF1800 family)